MPGKRVGGTIEQRSVTRIVRTGDHDVHWHVGEQRRVRATLERPTRGGAAVVSEHGDLRRLDRACGDQDWLGTRAHNTFDLGADMIGREFLAGAALADHHDAGIRLALKDRFAAPPVPMKPPTVLPPAGPPPASP